MALKNDFPVLARVVAEMGMRQRYVLAMVLRQSEQPVLHALAWELSHANTVESAVFAERECELSAHRFAEADRAFAEAGIPDPPAATGGPVFIAEDELPKRP